MARTLGGLIAQFRDAHTGQILTGSDGRKDTGEDYEIVDQCEDQWGRKWYEVQGPSGQTDAVLQGGTIWREYQEHDGQTLAEWVGKYAQEN